MMSTQVVVIGDVSGKCSTWMAGPTPILLWQSRASHKVVWDAHGNEIHYSVQTMITGIWRLELQESANKEMLSVKLTFQQWDLSLQFVFWRWIDKPICLDVGSRWRHSLFTHCWLNYTSMHAVLPTEPQAVCKRRSFPRHVGYKGRGLDLLRSHGELFVLRGTFSLGPILWFAYPNTCEMQKCARYTTAESIWMEFVALKRKMRTSTDS